VKVLGLMVVVRRLAQRPPSRCANV